MTPEEKLKLNGYIPAVTAAERVGRTVFTIYRWIRLKKLAGLKVGSYWYVKETSISKCYTPEAARLLGLTNKKS